MDLRGQAVAITGGAGDLARAMARLLLAHGARVALLDLNREGLAAARAELEGKVSPGSAQSRPGDGAALVLVAADLTGEKEVERALAEAERGMGGWTGLVNAAGIFQAIPIVDMTAGDWDRVMEVNLRSAFLASRTAVRRWSAEKRPGAIVSIASLAGQVGGIVAGANYAASKAGLISLTKSLAKQTAGLGIRINCINPGVIDSRMTRHDWPTGRLEAMVDQIPLRRLGTPDDVAGAVLFLLSPHAGYIHGAHLDVNGGIHMA